MLSILSLKALEECTIKDGVLTLGNSLPKEEFKELHMKLRAALLDHVIPHYKPVAVKMTGAVSFQRVINIHKDMSTSYLGMISEFSPCIVMPYEDTPSDNKEWVRKKGKDIQSVDTIRGLNSRSLGISNLMYARSVDCGPITLDKCIWTTENNSKREFLRPLIKDCKPIVTINDISGSMIFMHFVFSKSQGDVTCRDVASTIGNIGTSYLPIDQIYGMEEYILIGVQDVGVGRISITYKRDIDEEVLQSIFRQFAKKLLSHFESSMEYSNSPVRRFCTGDVLDIHEMWG